MSLNIVRTDKAPAAIGPYSQGIAGGGLLFVSGQIGLIPETGEIAGEDLASQARQALENMRQILLAGGSGLERVLSVDVFLTDMADFAEFNEIYQSCFSEHRPARAAVGVQALPKGARVEVRCVALCGAS